MKTLKEELEDILADMQDVNDKLARLVNDDRVEWPELETERPRREDYVLVEGDLGCRGCAFHLSTENKCGAIGLDEFDCTSSVNGGAIFKRLA